MIHLALTIASAIFLYAIGCIVIAAVLAVPAALFVGLLTAGGAAGEAALRGWDRLRRHKPSPPPVNIPRKYWDDDDEW
ncbi:MAG TPA: hypothetical protein VKB77_04375 [Terriglobales bacterium]|nr:hypothetical protein [Terriglobales bacterium]